MELHVLWIVRRIVTFIGTPTVTVVTEAVYGGNETLLLSASSCQSDTHTHTHTHVTYGR